MTQAMEMSNESVKQYSLKMRERYSPMTGRQSAQNPLAGNGSTLRRTNARHASALGGAHERNLAENARLIA